MTTRELFKKRVIELIHGLPYDDAIKKEIIRDIGGCEAFSDICGKKDESGKFVCEYCRRWGGQSRYEYKAYPITIGRVIKAIENKQTGGKDVGDECAYAYCITGSGYLFQLLPQFKCNSLDIHWELINSDGSECTDDDQTDETIESLYDLIK